MEVMRNKIPETDHKIMRFIAQGTRQLQLILYENPKNNSRLKMAPVKRRWVKSKLGRSAYQTSEMSQSSILSHSKKHSLSENHQFHFKSFSPLSACSYPDDRLTSPTICTALIILIGKDIIVSKSTVLTMFNIELF